MARFSPRTFAATALAAAVLAVTAVPAMAQPASPAPAASADAKPTPRPHERGPRMNPEQRQERMAKHAEAFKQKLKISADQEPAWNAFQAAMKPHERADHARLDPKQMDKLTTPERIDRMRAMQAQRSAEMDRRGDAVKTFYAALKPEQQKIFDQESNRMMHRFGPGEGKGGPRDGGPRGHKHAGDHKGKHSHMGRQAPEAAPGAPVQPQ